MEDSRQGNTRADGRESYASPKLTRHGSLGELTQGGADKNQEKSSVIDVSQQ